MHQTHSCWLCDHLATQELKSLYHHYSCNPGSPSKVIRPPSPFPSHFEYMPPPVFLESHIPPQLGVLLQRLLCFGLAYQTPQEPPEQQFTSPMLGLLDLLTGVPPLTHFTQPAWIRKFHRTHSSLITQIRSQLTTLSLTLNQVDKGHGLVVLHKSTLTQIYRSYLRCETTRVPPVKYKQDCDKLRNMLYDLDKNRKSYTDDRCPNLYFKYICRHTRPIVNHRPSLTTLCSDFFRPHLTPIIKNSVFLVEDVTRLSLRSVLTDPRLQFIHTTFRNFTLRHHTTS